MSPDLTNLKLLGIALAIGLLIGLERGWESRSRDEGTRIAGIRTFGLFSLLGALWGLIAKDTNNTLIGLSFLGLVLITVVAYIKRLEYSKDFGITSHVASLITFTLGVLTAFGHVVITSSAAVVITILLGFKPVLHNWLMKLEEHELHATLKLLLISVVMLPILPNESLDPWDLFVPFRIWSMVVLIASISYLGYFAIKIAGNRHGPVLSGFFGGLASSTAVTLNLSRSAKQHPEIANFLAAGIITACATMFPRTLLLASILNLAMLKQLSVILIAMSFVAYSAAIFYWQKKPKNTNTPPEVFIENPLQLGVALKFTLLLVTILVFTRILLNYFGDSGAYIMAAISGISDVDPITISMSELSKNELAISIASQAIIIAVTVNTLVKIIIAWVIGGFRIGIKIGASLALAVLAGFGTYLTF